MISQVFNCVTVLPRALTAAGAASLRLCRAFGSEAVGKPDQQVPGEFGLTPEQIDMKRSAEQFAKEELTPHGSEWDHNKTFPIDTFKRAAQLGLGGLYVKEDVGGSNLSRVDGAVLWEALSYGDISFASYLTIHNMVSSAICKYGTEELRQRYLPRLVTMESLSSYCLTEPNSGSDAASLSTSATRKGDHYVLNGSKAFISGAGASDVYLVMARSGDMGPRGISAFVVEKGTPGLTFGKNEDKLGWRSQPTRMVSLENVRVPASHLLGEEGNGFRIAMSALDGGRINIAACSVGGAKFCLDYAAQYVQERRQFGKAVGEFQATQFKLADMATQLHASRLMVHHAAKAVDAKTPLATMEAAMAKRFATDAGFAIANDALQLLGGYGYLQEYPVERYLRDLRVHCILEGTNEIMRMIIHRELIKYTPRH